MIRGLAGRVKFKCLRQYSVWRYNRAIENTAPIEVSTAETSHIVAMLCGLSTLGKGIGAAKSFFRFFPQTYQFHWHDDGSLTSAAKATICRHLPGVRIITHEEADDVVQAHLEKQGFSCMASLRNRFILLRKFSDVTFFGRGAKVLQFDSDVLFHQFPQELVDAIEENDCPSDRYGKDFGPAMAYSETDLQTFLQIPVLPCFNSGLMLTSVPDYDEFCRFGERLLEKCYKCERPWVLEQTLWAAWCTFRGAKPLPDPYDCTFRYGKNGNSEKQRVITQHYCGWSSPLFYDEFLSTIYTQLIPPNRITSLILRSI